MTENSPPHNSIMAICHRLRWSMLFLLALYVASFAAGYAAVSASIPFAVELRTRLLTTVVADMPFSAVVGLLRSRNLPLAIALAFLVNLGSGAFLSTTLVGAIPLLGAVGTSLVTLYRGFILGVVYYAVLTQSAAAFVLSAGTLILELGAYVFSGAAGMALSLATVFPDRYGVQSRWVAFRVAWIDAAKLYLVVAGLLLPAAIWEMTGLFFLLR